MWSSSSTSRTRLSTISTNIVSGAPDADEVASLHARSPIPSVTRLVEPARNGEEPCSGESGFDVDTGDIPSGVVPSNTDVAGVGDRSNIHTAFLLQVAITSFNQALRPPWGAYWGT